MWWNADMHSSYTLLHSLEHSKNLTLLGSFTRFLKPPTHQLAMEQPLFGPARPMVTLGHFLVGHCLLNPDALFGTPPGQNATARYSSTSSLPWPTSCWSLGVCVGRAKWKTHSFLLSVYPLFSCFLKKRALSWSLKPSMEQAWFSNTD
jgi:hypothetical protein